MDVSSNRAGAQMTDEKEEKAKQESRFQSLPAVVVNLLIVDADVRKWYAEIQEKIQEGKKMEIMPDDGKGREEDKKQLKDRKRKSEHQDVKEEGTEGKEEKNYKKRRRADQKESKEEKKVKASKASPCPCAESKEEKKQTGSKTSPCEEDKVFPLPPFYKNTAEGHRLRMEKYFEDGILDSGNAVENENKVLEFMAALQARVVDLQQYRKKNMEVKSAIIMMPHTELIRKLRLPGNVMIDCVQTLYGDPSIPGGFKPKRAWDADKPMIRVNSKVWKAMGVKINNQGKMEKKQRKINYKFDPLTL